MRRKWFGDLWEDMIRMQHEMEDVLSGQFSESGFGRDLPLLEAPKTKELMHWRKPLTDVYETDKEFISKIELPGLDKKEIKINLTEDSLEVKAEKINESRIEKKGYSHYERTYSGFYKHINLPEKIDVDKVLTSFSNGILEIKMSKKEPGKNKVKQIEVK